MIGYKTLNNGVKMPILGMGTDKIKDGKDVINLVKSAIKTGYKLIDTAELYHNETGVGIAIKESIAEGICKREDLFIQTKAPFHFSGYNNTYNGLLESLEKLGLDYVDMYLIHHPYRNSLFWEREIIDIYRAMETLYQEGKTKAIGVCNFNITHLNYLLKEAKIKPTVNQIEFNPMRQQRELLKYCSENNIIVQGWGTLNQGRIFDYPIFKTIGEKYKKNASQVAVKYSLQNECTALIRTQKEDRMIENIQIFDFKLNKKELEELDKLDGGEFSNNHFDIVVDKPSPVHYTYYLFGFLPILKKKVKHSGKEIYYLFGLVPLLKVKRKVFKKGKINE